MLPSDSPQGDRLAVTQHERAKPSLSANEGRFEIPPDASVGQDGQVVLREVKLCGAAISDHMPDAVPRWPKTPHHLASISLHSDSHVKRSPATNRNAFDAWRPVNPVSPIRNNSILSLPTSGQIHSKDMFKSILDSDSFSRKVCSYAPKS